MSHFLQRLMDRHRDDGMNREVNQQVLPRPKARFENNSGSGAIVPNELNQGSFQASYSNSDNEQNPVHIAQNTERILAAPQTRQVVQNVPTTLRQPLANDTVIQPTTARAGMESWNERIESLRLLFEQSLTRSEVLTGVNKSRNAIHQRSGREIQLTNNHEQSDNQGGTLVNQLNQHVQTILRRLNDPQQPEIDAEKTMESQLNSALSSNYDHQTGVNPDQINQLTVKPGATLDIVQPAIKEIKPADRAEQRESFQFGMLQTPNWLNELQADLNARWQEMNARETSETVVNITVGRIEIKAAPSSIVQQAKTRAKPTGVMNLDDYLKQRENGERR